MSLCISRGTISHEQSQIALKRRVKELEEEDAKLRLQTNYSTPAQGTQPAATPRDSIYRSRWRDSVRALTCALGTSRGAEQADPAAIDLAASLSTTIISTKRPTRLSMQPSIYATIYLSISIDLYDSLHENKISRWI